VPLVRLIGAPHVERVERAEFVEMALNQVGQFQQHLLPLEWLELGPGAFEGLTRRRYSAIDIFGVAFGHGREQFAGRGIAAFKALAGSRINPFAVDQHPLEGTVRNGMSRQWNRLRLGDVAFSKTVSVVVIFI
jgi:hypothetical protein